jgi:predicted acylesterase/phospholipase RssA
VVTGISTGALIAPFAFLGPEYDAVLREFYTTITTNRVLVKRGLLAAVFDDALADNRPLKKLLAQVVDQRVIDGIAAEYAKGRVLLIGTTDLDARRAVIWDIGAIASSGHPRAADLIRSIMLASAAIPAAFPPALIDVEVDGKPYQEMHVDGGTMTQVFLYPPSVQAKDFVQRERCLYIIRNARLDPDWAEVQRRTLPIAGRAIASLIHTQGIGDLYRLYVQAQRDGIDYNLAFIPVSFKVVPKEVFDRDYMNELYRVGYELARGGYPWQKIPPGFEPAAAPD